MAILKCKMCGGNLEVTEETTVCECEYCGTRQTVPTLDDEKKIKLFERANKLRANCEFDKAAGVYENIVADYSEEAEGYWGLLLCRYGIEYVDDPATGKKIPTCHRSSFESIMDDEDFEMVMENSDSVSRVVYRDEAKYIEEVRKGIIEVVGKEEPYDIFICYKETDENGGRTLDSVLAQEVYDALTQKGYKVFFSRISLEGKLGIEYEPYIFAALNSAKIMLVFGTSYDYYNAVWVKNEWSRYLKLMAKDKAKHLIPCFKNVDVYDIPKEFGRLQSQDMGKVGAVQDLLRGIEKILSKDGQKAGERSAVTVPQPDMPGVASLIRRGHLFLEDGEWKSAYEYFDRVLDIDPENAEAYFGQLLAVRRAHNRDELVNQRKFFEKEPLYQKALRFADADFRALLVQLSGIAEEKRRLDRERLSQYRKRIAPAADCIATGWGIAGLKSNGTLMISWSDNKEVSGWTDIVAIAFSQIALSKVYFSKKPFEGRHVVGLKSDGNVVAYGNNEFGQCNVSDWSDIVAIAVSESHTVGLKRDGSVVAAGSNNGGECNVSGWSDIVAIAVSGSHTVGLKRDGSVVAAGNNGSGQCDVSGWKDIVAIAVSESSTVGLKRDGSVAAAGNNDSGQCDVSGWKDIVAIAVSNKHTVGLKRDGSVVAVGSNGLGVCVVPVDSKKSGRCDVSGWSDIVAIAVSDDHTVGLKSNGSVVAVGTRVDAGVPLSTQCEVSGWKDIVAIAVSESSTVGLKRDGSVVRTGSCDFAHDWRLFQSLDTLEQERKEAREQTEREKSVRRKSKKLSREQEKYLRKSAELPRERAKLNWNRKRKH